MKGKVDLTDTLEWSYDSGWTVTRGQRRTSYWGYSLLDVLKAEKERRD